MKLLFNKYLFLSIWMQWRIPYVIQLPGYVKNLTDWLIDMNATHYDICESVVACLQPTCLSGGKRKKSSKRKSQIDF